MRLFFLSLAMLSSIMLTACEPSEKGSADLRDFVSHVKNKQPPPLAPLPTFKTVSQFNYSSALLKDPFIPTSSQPINERNTHRAKEPLENFPLDSLRMIGVLLEKGKRWAVILAPNGKTYEVTIGSYIGQNYGRVQMIARDKINVSEIVNDSDGWKNRTIELRLNSPGGEKNI